VHLCRPEIFRPIPINVIPQAFLASTHAAQQGASVEDLVRNGQFYAAAITSAQQLGKLHSTTEASTIFQLFYTRLACLTLINKACQETAAVESLELRDLAGTFYRHPITNEHIVPWNLRVIAVRLQSIGFKDWRRGIMALYILGQDARQEIAKASHDGVTEKTRLWTSRLHDLGIRTASMLVEMGDLEGAGRHLRTLEIEPGLDIEDMRRLKMMEALVWLQVGDLWAAKRCIAHLQGETSTPASPSFEATESDEVAGFPAQVFTALMKMAEGEFATAVMAWEALRTGHPTDAMIAQNLAICLLYTGRMIEAHRVLEDAVTNADVVSSHSLLFNLCTVYELCTERAREMKLRLTERVAILQPSAVGWERPAVDFKLESLRA
jgi:hypothetical protein